MAKIMCDNTDCTNRNKSTSICNLTTVHIDDYGECSDCDDEDADE